MNAAAIGQALDDMAKQLLARGSDRPFAVVGIRRGGEHLGLRLAKLLEAQVGEKVPMGVVDITLYRDDGFSHEAFPRIGVTKIPFDLRTCTVVLVDDVLYTGRTVRAALDAILDYGRPKAVRLAVLVDRGLREVPIAADAAGRIIQTSHEEHVDVQLTESGAQSDVVIIEPRQPRPEPHEEKSHA